MMESNKPGGDLADVISYKLHDAGHAIGRVVNLGILPGVDGRGTLYDGFTGVASERSLQPPEEAQDGPIIPPQAAISTKKHDWREVLGDVTGGIFDAADAFGE